jgi:hypothetical protein
MILLFLIAFVSEWPMRIFKNSAAPHDNPGGEKFQLFPGNSAQQEYDLKNI